MLLSDIAKKYNIDFSDEKIRMALDEVLKITRRNIVKFQWRFPSRATKNGLYDYQKDSISDLWWSGFWGGITWLSYEYTGDFKIRCYGERITDSVYKSIRKSGMHHNDIGMFVILTCVADYKICKNKLAKETLVEAADSLLTRYTQNHHVLASFDFERESDVLTLKISAMLNVMLLKYAYTFTGNLKYKEAFQHTVDLIIKFNIKPDGRTYFNTYFDKFSGEAIDTKVPYIVWDDDGKHSRNYAWALYALANLYSMTHNSIYAQKFDLVFEHMTKLCDTGSLFYLRFTADSQPDTASPSIVAAALTEIMRNDEIAQAPKYAAAAAEILNILTDNYSVKAADHCDGLIYGARLTGVTTVDCQSVLLGDYFYFEALMNSITDRQSFWYTIE